MCVEGEADPTEERLWQRRAQTRHVDVHVQGYLITSMEKDVGGGCSSLEQRE